MSCRLRTEQKPPKDCPSSVHKPVPPQSWHMAFLTTSASLMMLSALHDDKRSYAPYNVWSSRSRVP